MRTAGADSSAADGPCRCFDDEGATFVYEVYQRADAFLFGRRTYEIFAGYGEQWQIRATPSQWR